MFKNISAFMENLGPSQSAFYLIKEWNKARNNTSLSLGAFVNVHSMPVSTCLFSYKLSAFMSSYQGVLISTTVKNAAISLKMPTKMDRYLYLWDFEWTKGKPSYSSICEVLRNDKLKIITRDLNRITRRHALYALNCPRTCASHTSNCHCQSQVS